MKKSPKINIKQVPMVSMKRPFLFILLIFLSLATAAQKITITTLDKHTFDVDIVSDSAKRKLIQEFHGKQDNTIRKRWTARTYRLSDNRILLEFYDGQAALVKNADDFEHLHGVRFAKNYIDFLKKNITYKIEIPLQKAIELSKSAKRISDLKPDIPEYFDFEVYQMQTGQILFINKSRYDKSATVYENMKGLCSDNNDILSQYYQGMEAWTKKLISGDPLFDYDLDELIVYPKDIPALIKNHHLTLVESKVYVADFYGNLYKSDQGYYILIDEINQKNGSGNKMRILDVRIYEKIQDVRAAQTKYQKFKNEGVKSESFYQRISDMYGKDFPLYTKRLIDTLPYILNFDKEQLSFDSVGMSIVDEAIHWHHSNYKLFDTWFPGVLAYYGQCYMRDKKDGKWVVKKEKEYDVWTPHLVLSNNEDAFNVYDFYKDLFEWPYSIKEAGDWDGQRKKMRKKMNIDYSR